MSDLQESITIAENAGIANDKIMIDPGVGFAKTYEMNLTLINHLDKLHRFGYPVLLGASRKSVIGLTLNEPVGNRLEGTISTSVIAVMKGCHFLRVHDVKENLRAVRMTEAIINSKELI
jgi:dihydropteroate synthase